MFFKNALRLLLLVMIISLLLLPGKADAGIKIVNNADFPEFERWTELLKETAYLLPSSVLRRITRQDNLLNPFYLTVTFEEEDLACAARYFSTTNQIIVNTKPGSDPSFPFEGLAKDGYTNEEIVYLFLHEMGHAFDNSIRQGAMAYSLSRSYQAILRNEQTPSKYGWVWPPITDDPDSAIRSDEDFAESFAFYVLLPEYMKENFPLRYNWLKDNVFPREYEKNISPIPNSIVSRLTKPLT